MTAVGGFSPGALKALDTLGSVRRVTAADAPALSVKLANSVGGSGRRAVFAAAPGNVAAMATAAMGAARARGYLIAIDKAAGESALKFVRARAKRTIVVAGKKEISNAEAAKLRKPFRVGSSNAVARSARIAALGSRRGEAVLVDTQRVMAAAAAAASGKPVLFIQATAGNRKALHFLQASPAIAVLRSVGAGSSALGAARRA
jgi:hypothetical protein